MKTLTVNHKANQYSTVENGFMSLNIEKTIMKKLANTSPFLLLLLPLFMMIALTFAVNTNPADNGEVAVKSAKNSTSIVKQVTAILK